MKTPAPHHDTTPTTAKYCTGKCSWIWSIIRITLAVFLIVGAFLLGTQYSDCWDDDGARTMMEHTEKTDQSKGRDTVIQKELSYTNDPMQMNMSDMSQMLQGKTGDDLNKSFLEGMIPHHEAAIEMAKAIARSDKPELVKLGAEIITAQTAEIEQMQQLLIKWGYDTGTILPMMNQTDMMMNQVN